jgi:hypothetical protein
MYRVRVLKALACATAAMAMWAAPGYAKQTDVVTDCNAHGQLTHTYTLGQLRGALATMPPSIREYTNCFDVIQRQLDAQLGQSPTKPANSGDSGSGGSFLPLPVIIVLVVLVGAAGSYAVMAVRRRGGGGPPESS